MKAEDGYFLRAWIRGREVWWVVGLVVVVGALYARVAGFGLHPSFDDRLFVLGRPEVEHWWEATWRRRLLTPRTGYPIPIPTAIYAALRQWFGNDWIAALHVFQVSLHLLNIGLAWHLARRWWGASVGLLVVSVWGLHPVAVESLAWASNLKTPLFVAFALGSLLAWSHAVEAEGRLKRRGLSVLVCLLGVLALGCRPAAVLVPVMIVVVAWCRGQLHANWRLSLVSVVPLLLLAGVYLPVAQVGHESIIYGFEDRGSMLRDRWIRMANAVEFAARNLLLPLDLDPWYFLHREETLLGTLPGGSVILIVGMLLLALSWSGRWKLLQPLALGTLSYIPYSQITPIPRIASDTYLYFSGFFGIGFLSLVAVEVVLPRFTSRFDAASVRRGLLMLAMGASILLGALTHRQIERWRTPEKLWKPVLAEAPDAWRPYAHLLSYYFREGEERRAYRIAKKGLPIFQVARHYPAEVPKIYERMGREGRAQQLAIEMLVRHRSPKLAHYAAFFDVVVENPARFPNKPVVRRVVERASERYLHHPDVELDRSERIDIARWLARQGWDDSSVELLRDELARTTPSCEVWSVTVELPEEIVEKLEVAPKPPSRCTEAQGP